MKAFRDKAFRAEFPEISQALATCEREHEIMDSCAVKRADVEYLKSAPAGQEIVTGSMVGIDTQTRVFFFSPSGMLGEVRGWYDYTSNYAHESPRTEAGETVAEAIDRLGCAVTLHLIVEVQLDAEAVDHHSLHRTDVIVRKAPKGATVASIIEAMKTAEREAVRLEAAF